MLPVKDFVSNIASHVAEYIQREIQKTEIFVVTTQLLVDQLIANFDQTSLEINALRSETLRAKTELIYRNALYLIDTSITHQNMVGNRSIYLLIVHFCSL